MEKEERFIIGIILMVVGAVWTIICVLFTAGTFLMFTCIKRWISLVLLDTSYAFNISTGPTIIIQATAPMPVDLRKKRSISSPQA